ncbi:MAG: hypothetical protein JWN67_1756 [Actinomycetia bacterium]|nr:hypothetical protein [Actinomycetes bacterium]
MRIPGRGERTPRPGARPLDWLRAGPWGRFLRAAREQWQAPSQGRFVDAGYRAILERDPDATGRAHYVRGLRTGSVTRESVLRHLDESAEAARVALERPGMQDHLRRFSEAADAVPAGLRPVCFLHTMKCGGTALTHGLTAMCDPWPRLIELWTDQLLCMPRPLLERTMLVTGHLPYPVVELLPANTALLTVVREPVSRTLSHLAHLRTHGERPDLTLDAFLHDEAWHPMWRNYQARQLACDVPVGEAWLGRLPAGTLQARIDGPITIGDDELVERATKRLATIDVVGVADDLDAVLRRVAELWQKPAPAPLDRANESLAPLRSSEVPAALLDEIRHHTEVDAHLYDLARQRQ